MIDQDLDRIFPVKFNDALLFVIKADIVKLFRNKEIEFQIKIKDNKLILESPEILTDLGLQDNTPESEVINVQ